MANTGGLKVFETGRQENRTPWIPVIQTNLWSNPAGAHTRGSSIKKPDPPPILCLIGFESWCGKTRPNVDFVTTGTRYQTRQLMAKMLVV